MKRNPMLARIEAAAEARYQARLHASMDMLLQMGQDAAMIAANEVLQLGPGRAKAFCDAFSATLSEIANMTVADGKTDRELWHTKDTLDQRLRQICGEHFQPWEERYR